MESARCPQCGLEAVVSGSIVFPEQGAPYDVIFFPNDTSSSSKSWVRTTGVFRACASCGHLWSSIDSESLRHAIQVHGREIAKQQLDDFDHGPNRGLPDTEIAREIASKVAEIDALIRSGKPGAVGRYRELKRVTWDQAILETKNWRDLKRDEKLALFGWEPKPKEPVDDLDSPYP